MTSYTYNYFSLPLGYKFIPTDKELICDYLWRKINGIELESDAVVDMDVYAREPWFLHWENNPYMKCDERYYFVKRERNGKGKWPKRTLEGNLDGWWKANSGDKNIYEDGNLVGYMKTLTFYSYKKDNNRNRKEAINCNWTMHEYRLATNTFEQWVLCRIKNNAKSPQKKDGKLR